MSVRLFRTLLVVFLIHIIVLSVIWVGFPVPLPRPSAEFVYLGPTTLEEPAGHLPVSQDLNSDHINFDHFEASFFTPWVQLRQGDKPKK